MGSGTGICQIQFITKVVFHLTTDPLSSPLAQSCTNAERACSEYYNVVVVVMVVIIVSIIYKLLQLWFLSFCFFKNPFKMYILLFMCQPLLQKDTVPSLIISFLWWRVEEDFSERQWKISLLTWLNFVIDADLFLSFGVLSYPKLMKCYFHREDKFIHKCSPKALNSSYWLKYL